MSRLRVAAVLAALVVSACATTPGPDTCQIKVVGIEKSDVRDRAADVAFRVRGYAGGPAMVWLAAKKGPGDYLSGKGVEVGPGPFEAIVDLKLTGLPPSFVAVLEFGNTRCAADAKF